MFYNKVGYPGGGYTWFDSNNVIKPTSNKPKPVAKALFQSLEHGRLRKKDVVSILCAVNGRTYHYGYCNSTIAWHVNTGRLARVSRKGKTWFYITTKGYEYAEGRKLFDRE